MWSKEYGLKEITLIKRLSLFKVDVKKVNIKFEAHAQSYKNYKIILQC